MIKYRLFLLGVLITVVSCAPQTEQQTIKVDTYYDLVGLLDHQVMYLSSKKASLEKVVSTGGETETLNVTLDTTAWKDELKLFYNSNINKLGLTDAYETEQLSRIDGGRKLINSAKSNDQPVRLIEYNFSNDILESLRILVEEQNEVYTFKKEMQMVFTQVEGGPVMQEYSIKGTQEMVMKSDLNFSLNGKIILNSSEVD